LVVTPFGKRFAEGATACKRALEQLAKEKGIKSGGWVRVWSKRGSVKAKAVVTKRIRPLICNGKTVHIVGIPLHWGFMGRAKKGFGPKTH